MPVARLMLACATQWRVGLCGATGLDYNVLFLVAGALGINVDEKVLNGIRLLEGLSLERWRGDGTGGKPQPLRSIGYGR